MKCRGNIISGGHTSKNKLEIKNGFDIYCDVEDCLVGSQDKIWVSVESLKDLIYSNNFYEDIVKEIEKELEREK